MTKDKKSTKPQVAVYGIHPVLELLRARRRPLYQLYVSDPLPKAFSQIKPLIPAHIPVSKVKRDVLTRMADTSDHQGFVAITAPFALRKKPFDPQKEPFLVLIDSVQDTRNLGGILRTAHCTGVKGVIITGSHTAPINGATCKASAGLVEHLEIITYPNALIAAQEIAKSGFTLYLGALGGKNAMEASFISPLCIVIGNEGTGINPAILKMGESVMLPQKSPDISYNASVAAGILLFIAAQKNGFIG